VKRCLLFSVGIGYLWIGCSRSPDQEWMAAEVAYEAGEFSRALALATSAAERHPDAAPARRIWILSRIATGDMKGGLAAYDAIAGTAPLTATAPTAPLLREICLAVIRRSMQDANLFVRSAAVKALGEMGDRSHIAQLVPALKDAETFVRFFAVESLGRLGGNEAIQLLMAAGSDPDPMVRVAAVKALDDLEVSAQLFALFEGDAEATVQLFALAGRARRGDAKAAEVLLSRAKERREDPAAPTALGRSKQKMATDHLIDLLAGPEASIRMYAAEALGEIADPKAAPRLIRALQDPEATVRAAAATSLGKLDDPAATALLAEMMMKDTDPVARVSAAEGSFLLGRPDWSAYEGALKHDDYGVRHFTVGSLRKAAVRGDKAALEMLIRQIKDPAPRVRIAVVRALGEAGDPSAIPVLKAQFLDEDLAVRTYAAGNLARLLSPDPPKGRATPSAHFLIE